MADQFQTTRWSVVLSAGRDGEGAREALEWLCRTYWYPLYAFVRRQGFDADEAQDLTQAFFLSLLEYDSLRQDGDRLGSHDRGDIGGPRSGARPKRPASRRVGVG